MKIAICDDDLVLNRKLHQFIFETYHDIDLRIDEYRSGEEFLQIQQVRYVVEGLAIRLVIRNCSAEEIKSLFSFAPTPFNTGMTNEMQNQKFHTEIGRLSKNEAARQIIFDMTGIASRAAHTFKYLQESTPEYSHEALVEAMLNRDVDRSLQILRKHLALDSEGL